MSSCMAVYRQARARLLVPNDAATLIIHAQTEVSHESRSVNEFLLVYFSLTYILTHYLH